MEHSAEELNEHIDNFTSIGDDVNPIPDNIKVTVYCEGLHERGFAENIIREDLGISELIAKSWILQEDLDKLFGL